MRISCFVDLSHHLTLLVVLVLASPHAGAQCTPLCGDCDGDGRLGVLDSLMAAQIATALLMATPEQQIACDVDPGTPDGDVDVVDALVLAQSAVGIPVNLGCFPIVVAPEGYGVPTGVLHTEATVSDPNRTSPSFGCALSTVFFEVLPDPMTQRIVITVSGMSIPTDMDLYIGAPGVPPGDTNPANYSRYSRLSGAASESLELACSGLSGYGASVAVAVHAFSAGGFRLSVEGDATAVCSCGAPTIESGTRIQGMMTQVRGPCPPLPCGPASRQYELPSLPPGTTSLTICMIGPDFLSDYDLWMGLPGVCAGDCYVSNFHGSLTGPTGWRWGNPDPAELITIVGSELASYGGGPIALGVSVFDGPVGGGPFTLDALASGSGGSPIPSVAGVSPVEGSVSTCRTCASPTIDIVDVWSFQASAGDSIEVSVDTVAAGSAFDPAIEVRLAGTMAVLASADQTEPCSESPPGATGNDCPRIQMSVGTTSTYEITVQRAADGFCTDSRNGRYALTVTVAGIPVLLTPVCDDC